MSAILKREIGFDYQVVDDKTVLLSTPEDILCNIIMNESSNEMKVSFNMRLDPVTVVSLMKIINKVSVLVKMEVSLYESFTTRTIDDAYELLCGEDAYIDLGYTL